MSNTQEMERKSSAVTLSDMEVFVFPELIYSLVLANLMSPRIWRWRDDPWFAGLGRMKPYRRITRLKQYIMDHYAFNLDLDTWGLTTAKREIARFSDFLDMDTLRSSNALFGYEGDKYYFDIDIRTHFGLDKLDGSVIPYWKTETVEAMDAFAHKPSYTNGAGECVSLATLYAAALFVVAGVPLKDIFLMATPLHSQNFIDIDDGILTNNRRLVTKKMWFNGTALSAQARRALENEQVTIVAHESGTIHTIYPEATIGTEAYARYTKRLKNYLRVEFSEELLGNFLRHDPTIQKCFQMRWLRHGVDHYIGMDRVMIYEAASSYSVTDATRDKLMADIEGEEFRHQQLPSRIVLNDLEAFIRQEKLDLNDPADGERLKEQFASDCLNAEIAIECLRRFCHVQPRLPDATAKRFVSEQDPLGIDLDMTREEIIDRLEEIRDTNTMADMAFHAYRDLTRTDSAPFLLAAVQRNPVSVAGVAELDEAAVLARIQDMPTESIYDGDGRLAQPDEVWNFGRGDGAEKAVLLANILRARQPEATLRVLIRPDNAVLESDSGRTEFPSAKNLPEAVWEIPAATSS